MNESRMKTYKDSFLYKNKLKSRSTGADGEATSKTLQDYILNAVRVDKSSPAFAGIIEDVKRQQTSRVVYSILMMDKVYLCINNFEVPAAYKVIDAKDIKNRDNTSAIFIDCTGIMEYKNGYYICKKIDVLITYLYDAMVYLLYRYNHTKLMNSSDIILSSTNCYVSLLTYILDYMRIIGYAENKNKIAYLIGLFYLNNLMGKEIDPYTKNIAAKVAGVNLRSIDAYDLYLEDGIFDDINVFIGYLAKVFSLKGLNLEVVVGRWAHLIGNGTHYALELFTNLGMLLCSAYCGSYVVNQRQIERACGSNMIKFNNAIRSIADSSFGHIYSESYEYHEKRSIALSDAIKLREQEEPKCAKKNFSNIDEALSLVESYKDYYRNSNQENLLSRAVMRIFDTGLSVMENYINNKETAYEEGVICACSKECKKLLKSNEEINKVINLINSKILLCESIMTNESADKDDRSRASRCLVELREAKSYI